MTKLKRGFFLMEGVVTIGIFAIFLTSTLPLIKNSVKIREITKKTIRNHRDHYRILETIQKEVKRGSETIILNQGKCLKFKKNSETILYCFTGGGNINKLIRFVEGSSKKEIVFERVKGCFLNENNFFKMIITFDLNNEEEYIWK